MFTGIYAPKKDLSNEIGKKLKKRDTRIVFPDYECKPIEFITKYNKVRGEFESFINMKSVTTGIFHFSFGNGKLNNSCDKSLEKVLNFSFDIESTCDHNCDCYKEKDCYGTTGFFTFPTNRISAAENFNWWMAHTSTEHIETICNIISLNSIRLTRYFEIGDLINLAMLDDIVEIAKRNPNTKFWFYTKKYRLVNRYCDMHGFTWHCIPENLTIIFSHWRNSDGTYFTMDNPYDFPTAEFIPYGMESDIKPNDHICPCGDPNIAEFCANCSNACYNLKHGQSMCLLEHSTEQTKARDEMLKASHLSILQLVSMCAECGKMGVAK